MPAVTDPGDETSGRMVSLFRRNPHGLTKSDLVRLMGLSRTTITQRLEPRLTARLLTPSSEEARTGGRPADRFVIDPDGGVLLVADMGAHGLRAAVCDMMTNVRTE